MPKPSAVMNSRGTIFSRFATASIATEVMSQRYGFEDLRRMTGITAFLPGERELDRGLADGVGLFDVHLRGDVARGALQVVGERPVVLVAVRLLDHLRERRRDAAELHVPERVACVPMSERNLPSASRTPSEATTTQ